MLCVAAACFSSLWMVRLCVDYGKEEQDRHHCLSFPNTLNYMSTAVVEPYDSVRIHGRGSARHLSSPSQLVCIWLCHVTCCCWFTKWWWHCDCPLRRCLLFTLFFHHEVDSVMIFVLIVFLLQHSILSSQWYILSWASECCRITNIVFELVNKLWFLVVIKLQVSLLCLYCCCLTFLKVSVVYSVRCYNDQLHSCHCWSSVLNGSPLWLQYACCQWWGWCAAEGKLWVCGSIDCYALHSVFFFSAFRWLCGHFFQQLFGKKSWASYVHGVWACCYWINGWPLVLLEIVHRSVAICCGWCCLLCCFQKTGPGNVKIHDFKYKLLFAYILVVINLIVCWSSFCHAYLHAIPRHRCWYNTPSMWSAYWK